jgi:hypothetical protein
MRFREAGAAGYLSRPVASDELAGVVEAAASGDLPAGTLVTRHWLREHRSRLRVLVADDSPTNRVLAVRLLEKRGHVVTAVGSGRDAVAHAAKGGLDVVLMDVQMPDLDGLEATAEIREREAIEGGHLPIVALTAHAMESHRQRCLDAGMDAYLSKPFDAEELCTVIERAARSGAGPAPDGEREGESAPVGLDRTVALSNVDGDGDLVAEVARAVLEEGPTLRASLSSAVAESRFGDAVTAAIRLRRSLESIGAMGAGAIAGAVADAARVEEGADAAALLEDLADAFDRVEGEIVALAGVGVSAWR